MRKYLILFGLALVLPICLQAEEDRITAKIDQSSREGRDRMCESVTPKGTLPPLEREALIALYNACNGPNWNNRTNWRNADDTDFNDPGTEGSWYGVTTDSSNTRVLMIELVENNLKGSLPSEIGNLPGLVSLNLTANGLTSLPPEIGALATLTSLSLFNNELQSLPPEIGNLSHLGWLSLGFNHLPSVPAELGRLTSLWYLDMAFNQLSSLPSEFWNLSNLQYLYLGQNQFTSLSPSVGNLSRLNAIGLSCNRISSLPSELGQLTNLHSLNLFSNRLTTLPQELADLASLRYLCLDKNQFSAFPWAISGLILLRELFFSGNKLQGSLPDWLADFKNLANGDGLDLRWNALYTSNSTLKAFLNQKQQGGDWESTQTIAPADVSASPAGSGKIEVSWTPILYTGDYGGYGVLYSTAPGGPYSLYGKTSDKRASSMTVRDLQCETKYFFAVASATFPNSWNFNIVVSELSTEATSLAGSPLPVIPVPSSACGAASLSTQSFTTYQWYLNGFAIPGATDQSYRATVNGSYSVAVTDISGCQGMSASFELTMTEYPLGDCDNNCAVSIGEVQKAINMFLGAIAPDCGVDCNGDGAVSIGELQKVINAFLGLPASC